MALVLWWTLVWISGYCHRLSADVVAQYKYFHPGGKQKVSLQVPDETKGTEFIWEWTSHDGRYTNTRITTIQSDGTRSWNLGNESISNRWKYGIYLQAKLENAGVYTFIRTKPEEENLAQFEVFAVKVTPYGQHRVNGGSDVHMSCEVSHLPHSVTLDWERDGEPTANTTLIYNKAAHIIIHSADRHSEGTYKCTLRWNRALIFSFICALKVNEDTYDTRHTLFRGSLNSSEVVLISHYHSRFSYGKAAWSWVPVSETKAIPVASANKHGKALMSMDIDKERFSSEGFDGYHSTLRISPVKFGDSGRYTCHYDSSVMATVSLVTVQVSAELPGGLSRNQSVVLNCEISQVTGSVTLAWLRMKGSRGELVKQEVLTQPHPKRMLSLTLPSLSEDQLHWACVVFTGSMLRAQVPLHLTLPTTPITQPEEPKPDEQLLVIILACTAVACVGLLLLFGGLLLHRLKRPTGPSSLPAEGSRAADTVHSNATDQLRDQGLSTLPVGGNGDSSAADAVYSNITDVQNNEGDVVGMEGTPGTPAQEKGGEELQYLVFARTAPGLNPNRQQRHLNPQSRSEQEENDKVVYASICKT